MLNYQCVALYRTAFVGVRYLEINLHVMFANLPGHIPAEEELIVNVDALAKDKFQVAADDIIEISVPSAATSKYVLIDWCKRERER